MSEGLVWDALGIPEISDDEEIELDRIWKQSVMHGGIDLAETIFKYHKVLKITPTPDTLKMSAISFVLGRRVMRNMMGD